MQYPRRCLYFAGGLKKNMIMYKYIVYSQFKNKIMTTTETINDKSVNIEWEFIDIQDRHDSNWCEWTVSGTDTDGNLYLGSCQADGSDPYDMHDKVTDIEQVALKIQP